MQAWAYVPRSIGGAPVAVRVGAAQVRSGPDQKFEDGPVALFERSPRTPGWRIARAWSQGTMTLGGRIAPRAFVCALDAHQYDLPGLPPSNHQFKVLVFICDIKTTAHGSSWSPEPSAALTASRGTSA
ncbi:hypothetical protein C8Q76DRAFT_330279 [Earliella scabrosa]|nr:hypothetical protein C8Q76DRAFT_330279 [Earliella scabrosa]